MDRGGANFSPPPLGVYNLSVAQNFREDLRFCRKSIRFSKISTEMCNTSKTSSEKSSFNSEIICEFFFLKKSKKTTLFRLFNTENSWVHVV